MGSLLSAGLPFNLEITVVDPKNCPVFGVHYIPYVFTSNCNDQQILQSLLGPEVAIRFETLAQAIVNETEEMPRGSSMGHAPFWNLHRDKLIEVGRSRPFETFRKQADEALENLYIAIESAEQRLREMREELARKHGQPYVMEAPSYGMASSMDRPLGW